MQLDQSVFLDPSTYANQVLVNNTRTCKTSQTVGIDFTESFRCTIVIAVKKMIIEREIFSEIEILCGDHRLTKTSIILPEDFHSTDYLKD